MRHIAVMLCLLSLALSATAADMTHEETIVRTAYAKFAYAVQQKAISDLLGRASVDRFRKHSPTCPANNAWQPRK